MNKETVLNCSNVSKSFTEGGLAVDVLQNINLNIKPAEQIAIIGSSGSGKSTLLHLLGGLDNPTKGEVWVAGKQINKLNPAKRAILRNQNLGFVYQFHHLLQEFTAIENVAMPLLIKGDSSKEAKEKAVDILTKVGLEKRLEHKPGEMSGGERQRAAVARALVTNPKCLLADEPTGNLDQRTADKVYELMLDLNQTIGTSLILVTHAPDLAQRMDRILRLVDGKLVEE
ncbi:lipoprotein-releasing ABC transporter ATP-binding protein LolD [Candidatus Marithrix sp. Canyon 246]|uniref:lipoprotein-releasing ABC transporter ATP-binding protein LolD n=1 Tax=Candidatus Marithrix sp. Canyon 246 TaxID=1827136 RepID=UPI00084A2A0E|nr:lipoprotein-releasing ABC transporter ATP-binding protein LolD [Candidatus Marithrix sp. Canyon 246]